MPVVGLSVDQADVCGRMRQKIHPSGLTVRHVFDRMTVMEFVVEQLAEAIDALAALDVDTLSDAELHGLVVAMERQRARLVPPPPRCWPAGTAAELGRRRVTHPRRRLARETNTAVASAKVEVRRAGQLASMPATAAAVAAGSLSLDHVDLLARANRPWRHAVFAEHEAMLVVQCATLRFAEAVRLVEYWCRRADAAAADDDAARCRESARLHASTTIDGRVVLNGELDPAGGAAVVGEVDRLEREQYLADERGGIVRTVGQRRAAATGRDGCSAADTPLVSARAEGLTFIVGSILFTGASELSSVEAANSTGAVQAAPLHHLPVRVAAAGRGRSTGGPAIRRAGTGQFNAKIVLAHHDNLVGQPGAPARVPSRRGRLDPLPSVASYLPPPRAERVPQLGTPPVPRALLVDRRAEPVGVGLLRRSRPSAPR